MTTLPKDMNWKAFIDYIISQYDWFGTTVDEFLKYEGKKDYAPLTRAGHIFSDIEIKGEEVVLNVQKDDPFIEGIEVYLSTMNRVIRKKYDCFFSVNKVDYV